MMTDEEILLIYFTGKWILVKIEIVLNIFFKVEVGIEREKGRKSNQSGVCIGPKIDKFDF